MGAIFSFFKIIIFTVLIALALQVRWGEKTLEQHAGLYLSETPVIEALQPSVDGAVKLLRNTWNRVTLSFKDGVQWSDSSAPGGRSLVPQLKRSEEYLREQSLRAKEKIEAWSTEETEPSHEEAEETESY